MYIRCGRLPLSDALHQRNGIHFVWNREKAESNLQKHGISCEVACEVFFDPFVLLLRSDRIGGEELEALRLISGRPATSAERAHYEDPAAP